MGFGLDLKGIGDILTGAGTLAKDVRSAVTGEISPEKKAELALKAQEMELALSTAQTRINEIEAGSSKWFVASWRPAVGWICAMGLFYGTIGKPFIEFIARVFGYAGEFPAIDSDTLNTTLFGMLGLGVMRTAEKIKGAAGNH
jgi:hypothetical protein